MNLASKPADESLRTWLTVQVVPMVKDTSLRRKDGRQMSEQERKVKAVRWVRGVIFGAHPVQFSTLIELITRSHGSAVNAARVLLSLADVDVAADDVLENKLIGIVKYRQQQAGLMREAGRKQSSGAEPPPEQTRVF